MGAHVRFVYTPSVNSGVLEGCVLLVNVVGGVQLEVTRRLHTQTQKRGLTYIDRSGATAFRDPMRTQAAPTT